MTTWDAKPNPSPVAHCDTGKEGTMGRTYQENYRRIRQEYDTKYIRAEEAADARLAEVHAAIPELDRLDRRLSGLGLEILRIVHEGGDINAGIAALRTENERLQSERRTLLVSHGYPPDYTDIKYECPLCGDTGFVDCRMCVCMRRRLIEAGYESSGVGELLRTQSFENFSMDYYSGDPVVLARMRRIFTIMKDYAESFVPGQADNLALFGGTGLGKTHLSSAVAAVVISRGCDVLYTSAVGMLADFERQRFGNTSGAENSTDTDRYYDCDLLIIDDLGTEVNNQFTASVLYDIINTRLNRRMATIISTNLNPDEFRKRYWDRITSRVLGEYSLLQFMGKDIREQKLAERSRTGLGKNGILTERNQAHRS